MGAGWGINNTGQIACQGGKVDNLDVVGLLLTPVSSPLGAFHAVARFGSSRPHSVHTADSPIG